MAIVIYLMKCFGKVSILILFRNAMSLLSIYIACHISHFCKTNEENDRVFYRTFVTGILSSFFGVYLQGNRDLLQYITEVDQIPIKLGDLKTDLMCY